MAAAWLTADLHFGHRNIISFCDRPHDTVDQMNRDIIDRWNSKIAPGDHVSVLGDVCMGQLSDSVPLIDELNGFKVLVPGNHDPVWSGCSANRREKWFDVYNAAFQAIASRETYKATLGEKRAIPIVVSHFPYMGHDYRDFDDYRPIDKGEWLVHGHVHDLWRQSGRQINVGIDAWGGYPVSVEEIEALIDAGPRDLEVIRWS